MGLGGKGLYLGQNQAIFYQPAEAPPLFPAGVKASKEGKQNKKEGGDQEAAKNETGGQAYGGMKKAKVMVGMADVEMRIEVMILQDQEGRNERSKQGDPSEYRRKG